MPLFNTKTMAAALAAYDREPRDSEIAAAANWAAKARVDFNDQNEAQLESELNSELIQTVLGYVTQTAHMPGTVKAKEWIGKGCVDLALGRFTREISTVLAPIELKRPKVSLDGIMPGRAKTPVQQAWEYANDAVGAKWVIVSDMRDLRLYAVGHGRAAFENFDLRRIDDSDELCRLQLLLHADQLLSGATADLLARSGREDRDITNALYADYRSLRDDLLQFVRDQRPQIAAELRIALVQKLLDRVTFIAFAEDSVLVPDNSIRNAVEFANPYDPQPKWIQMRRLFDAVDRGAAPLNIPPYNGGLFATDPNLDALDLPDALVERFTDISKYDFKSQVSVSILGHIFEQSITDIEALQAEARGEPPPKTTTRKRHGVVYTPEFVTRFIVEHTVGTHLAEVADALMAEHADGIDDEGAVRWRNQTSERDYWRAYLERLTSMRVVDPACGSGAFLIAAFDHLHAEQRRVRERLSEIDGGGILAWAEPNADVEIITSNLYGVDVNAESVEITKLSLWLKTAKRNRPLESLARNIRVGNSLIEDADFHARAFVWCDAFPAIFDQGGFDIVIGNPPYVRMELLKPIKPYLETRYAVVSDRADLYAYFFELGLRILKPGGRLGYISSSTFFRTGSGSPLRKYLGDAAEIEAVVDFGDLQLFEGVTTYPAILTMRKAGESPGNAPIRFLNVKTMPPDLGLAFNEGAEQMPRARLSAASWRFEGDRLDAIRAKMAAGRRTLAEVYGAPLCGIKTGFNEAFVIPRDSRDALVARDPRSAELLKPFLIGENLKRWHIENDDLWLIYTPKNRVDIDDYPAIREHLSPFRDQLENRATKQNWWELQQAQEAYVPRFESAKMMWPEFSQGPKFSVEAKPHYVLNKVYFVPAADFWLMAVMGSTPSWFRLHGEAGALRGGQWRLVMSELHVSKCPIPGDPDPEMLRDMGKNLSDCAIELNELVTATLHRLADLAPALKTSTAFRVWPDLDFARLRALIFKHFRTDIAPGERDHWESWFAGKRAEAAALRARIAAAEAEINDRVYRLFDLDKDEIAAIEDAMAGQY